MSADSKCHITAIASDAASAMYRFTIPIRALIEQGTATGNVSIGLAQNPHFRPGSPLLLQGQLTLAPAVITAAKRNCCRLVLDFADLLWPAPGDNPNAHAFSPELDRRLACADVLTVSTEPLAAALRERGYDPAVIPNIVDPRDWTVQPQRAERTRPRIGWYDPGPVHAGDLVLIEQVVRTLIDEADFVFFGQVPAALNDILGRVERCVPIPLTLFPALLAALDLDIVLRPLARNAFNECQSNLPLLQAGMLGYPVIASDIEGHRTLPVTRLPNTPVAWITALRDRMHDPAALRHEGETLRRAVHAGFLAQTWTGRYLALWTGTSRA